MIKPAAEFLANGDHIKLTLNGKTDDEYWVTPPWTRLERWEEQKGYSPSTEAAEITGLLVAADIARTAGDPGAATFYEGKADQFAARLPNSMFTTTGVYKDGQDNGKYYLRITQNEDPNDGQPIDGSNGNPGLDERKVLDAGFLELVRYGVRAANDGYILDSLPELDDTSLPEDMRVKYLFTFGGQSDLPGWRRYSDDGYGERTDNGCNWVGGEPAQRGRVWPIFTGERGHFELERIKAQNKGNITTQQINDLKATYIQAMEGFANEGLMLPEQVFDGVDDNSCHHFFVIGEGTNSATPLAWSHAEYIKLVKSLTDHNTWDSYSVVRDHPWPPSYQHIFQRLFLRGTNNGWQTTQMTLIGLADDANDPYWRLHVASQECDLQQRGKRALQVRCEW